MRISFNCFLESSLTTFQDRLLSTLTEQQKKIALIVAAAFSALALLYLCRNCIQKSYRRDNDPSEDDNSIQNPVDPKNDIKQTELDELKKADEQTKLEKLKKVEEQRKLDEQRELEELKKLEQQKLEEEEKLQEQKKQDDHKRAKEIAAADRKANKMMNVLILGGKSSGKTTLSLVLNDSFYEDVSLPFAEIPTKQEVTDIVLKGYRICLLDTSEINDDLSSDYVKAGEKTRELVAKHFGGQKYDNVDAVLFTFSFAKGISNKVIENLQYFLRNELPSDIKKRIVITGSELFSVEEGKEIQNEIVRHSEMVNLVEKDFGGKEKVLFSGNRQKQSCYSKSYLSFLIQQVATLRLKIIQDLLPDSLTRAERKDILSHEQEVFESRLMDYVDHYPLTKSIDTDLLDEEHMNALEE